MHRLATYLLAGVVILIALAAATPALSDLARSAVPFIVALGVVAIAVRLVFFHTRRW